MREWSRTPSAVLDVIHELARSREVPPVVQGVIGLPAELRSALDFEEPWEGDEKFDQRSSTCTNGHVRKVGCPSLAACPVAMAVAPPPARPVAMTVAPPLLWKGVPPADEYESRKPLLSPRPVGACTANPIQDETLQTIVAQRGALLGCVSWS